MFSQIQLAIAVILCLLQIAVAFKPTGKYDLGPADLNALCPMVKEFGDTGIAPKPVKIEDDKMPKGCVYFQWVTCSDGEKDPKRPCGWYEMKKCDGEATGRSALRRSKRSKPNRGSSVNEPVFLDFQLRNVTF